MAKLGEGLRNISGAAADSIGLTGIRSGWKEAREGYRGRFSVPVAAGSGVLLGVEEIVGPNLTRDLIIDDNLSTTSEYPKSGASFSASMFLDGLSFAGSVGVGVITRSLEAAIVTKVALNAVTSFAVRTADSIQRERTTTR
ncbi:MAG: hypothetical protein AAB532_04020 [Patescibacteria group bacterium]